MPDAIRKYDPPVGPAHPAFRNHPTYAVETETLDTMQAATLAVIELRNTLRALEPCYRFLSLAVVTDELTEVYRLVAEADAAFKMHGLGSTA
jgi:hypothetical protein